LKTIVYLTLTLATTVFLSSCVSGGGEAPKVGRPSDWNSNSILTGKPQGTGLNELVNREAKNSTGLPVNALLWRASLDIASFVPLDDVDTFGGSIVTEWYVPEDKPNKRLKLAVFVLGRELRSDAIQVRAYVQTRKGNGWTNVGRDSALSQKLENLILTRARELRAAVISETSN